MSVDTMTTAEAAEGSAAAREAAVRLEDVGLCYRLARQRIPSFKEYAIHWMKGALSYEKLWAVDGVTLTIERGESVGVIGRNGAGKSTLMKVITGVLRPTRGVLETRGWIAPILELGTGFDHELTGYENLYLNALLLGRTRQEIDEQAESIIEFSGLRDFIHTPIRNYSTGMLARLGFSIATAWRPDLLILDEVLAVGDATFLHRCQRRLEEILAHDTTLLLVSHDLKAVTTTCRRAIWIDKGRVRMDGPSEEVVASYRADSALESRQSGQV